VYRPFYCCGWRYYGVLKLCNRKELHMDVKCDAWVAKDNSLMRMTDDDDHPSPVYSVARDSDGKTSFMQESKINTVCRSN